MEESVVISFLPPDWIVNTERPAKDSEIYVTDAGGIKSMVLHFGRYEEDRKYDPTLHQAGEAIAEGIEDTWFDTRVGSRVYNHKGNLSIMIDIEDRERTPWPPDIASDIYADAQEFVHEEAPGGEVHPLPEDIAPLDAEEGMLLDHPDFDGTVRITEVDSSGNVIAEDEAGIEVNLRGHMYEDLTREMLVGTAGDPKNQGFGKPPRDISTNQKTLETAIRDAIRENVGSVEAENDIMAEIEAEIEEVAGGD